MEIKKWDFKLHKYLPFEVDTSRGKYPLYSDDMDEVINCINCNRKVTVGSCFTSRKYHNNVGLGYNVCPACHESEMKEEDYYRRKENE